MRIRRPAVIGLLVLFAAVGVSRAVTVADYQSDYLAAPANGMMRPAVSADGWDYMWNASAAIGTAAGNYSSLESWTTSYNFDGAGGLPRANPAAYVYLHATGGHPGRGVTDHSSAIFDRSPAKLGSCRSVTAQSMSTAPTVSTSACTSTTS